MDNDTELIQCPFCAEKIQKEAKICRHCGNNVENASKPWYLKKFSCLPIIIIILAICGFFFWPLWLVAAILAIASAISSRK